MTDNFTLDRLINRTNTSEGSIVPPRQSGEIRVPLVTNLRTLSATPHFGGTLVTLAWDNPDISSSFISHFNVYASGLNRTTQPQGLSSTQKSPATVWITSPEEARIIFTVQTQLSNGLASRVETSPSVAVTVPSPTISSTPITLENLILPTRTITSGPETLTTLDCFILADTTSGAFSLNLPPSPPTGLVYYIKKANSANNLTINGNGNNIDGALSLVYGATYATVTLIYNGTEWSII